MEIDFWRDADLYRFYHRAGKIYFLPSTACVAADVDGFNESDRTGKTHSEESEDILDEKAGYQNICRVPV